MKEDEDFLDNFLMHHDLTHAKANYDKVKTSQYNREYYLRNRQLKGRKGAPGKEVVPQNNQPNQQQQELQKRIARLRTRLKSLKTQLSEILVKAKEKKEKAAKKDEKQTTAEKQKAARESRKYRETHKSELKAKQEKAKKEKEKEKSPKNLDDMTESEIRAEIKSVQRKLNEAIARARSMAK